MTRLERLLLHVPRLRSLVLERDAFAGHCARLQRELAESLERERALRKEFEVAEQEGAARERALAPGRTGGSLCEKMRDDWDGRARSEGLYFIATGQPEWTEEAFFRSGEENVRDHILTDLDNICRGRDPKQMRVVEIGCGAGRLTLALAAIFGEVHGVDVSPEMIRLAREKLAGLGNVRLYVNNGADLSMLPDGAFHFAFSFIVFQHIPDEAVIESYVREAYRVLEPGALFKFQVEGGAAKPRAADDTWHGVSYTEDKLRELAGRAGFELRYTEGAGTQYFWAWCFKG